MDFFFLNCNVIFCALKLVYLGQYFSEIKQSFKNLEKEHWLVRKVALFVQWWTSFLHTYFELLSLLKCVIYIRITPRFLWDRAFTSNHRKFQIIGDLNYRELTVYYYILVLQCLGVHKYFSYLFTVFFLTW